MSVISHVVTRLYELPTMVHVLGGAIAYILIQIYKQEETVVYKPLNIVSLLGMLAWPLAAPVALVAVVRTYGSRAYLLRNWLAQRRRFSAERRAFRRIR